MARSRRQQGFIHLHLLLLVALVIVVVGGTGYVVYMHSKSGSVNSATNLTTSNASKSALNTSVTQKETLAKVNATATGGGQIKATLPTSNSTAASEPSTSTTSSSNSTSTSTSSSSQSGASSTTMNPAYNVTGTFYESPSSPVCSVSSPCTAPITNHTIDVYKSCDPSKALPCSSKPYTTTTTNSKGQFSLQLSADTYTLELNPAVGVSGQSWSFTKISGTPLTLQLTAETGIR